MSSLPHTLFFFLIALSILVAFHEFGHYWVARKLGVRVLRFSVGFGKPFWRYQKDPESTEFVLAAIPLGGYVQLFGEKKETGEEAPDAFFCQPVWKRMAIVLAGPIFNLVLAIFFYWIVFVTGETGVKPVINTVPDNTFAASAGFEEQDEIIAVDGKLSPTWSIAMTALFTNMLDHSDIAIKVRGRDGIEVNRMLHIPREIANNPADMHEQLGLQPWTPAIPPILDTLQKDMPAELAGLRSGDRVVSADNQAINNWQEWVEYVRARPEIAINLVVERDGSTVEVLLTPQKLDGESGVIGRIGASVLFPEELIESMRSEYQLGPIEAISAATQQTYEIATVSLKMMGRIVTGDATVKNLSGPISIAQYAGKSASLGASQFLKFLALVSVSLGVLNLLPIPMLDGGHFLFYTIEAIKGSPVSEQMQFMAQQVGIALLLSLMCLTFYLDIERLFN